MPKKHSGWKIVQFSTDGTKIRLVPRALVDGYHFGDRFLEGALFEVLVDPEGNLTVEASIDTNAYLDGVHASVKKWNKRALEYVVDAGDTLFLDTCDEVWDTRELHLTHDISFYTSQNYTLVQ